MVCGVCDSVIVGVAESALVFWKEFCSHFSSKKKTSAFLRMEDILKFLIPFLLLFSNFAFADGYNYWGLSKGVNVCGFISAAITNINMGSYSTLQSAVQITQAYTAISVSNTTTSPLSLAVGAAGSEQNANIFIPVNAVGEFFPIAGPPNTRVAVTAFGANVTSGYVTICFYK